MTELREGHGKRQFQSSDKAHYPREIDKMENGFSLTYVEQQEALIATLRGMLTQAESRAEAAEAALAQCQAWRQEDADNLNHCIRAKQKLFDDRLKLRLALAQLVGVDTVEELQNMEAIMRAAPAPAKDKASAIDAIHALIEVQP